jgi:hypothetical protein
VADRLFGDLDPIGERITLEIEERRPPAFTIVGVTAAFAGRSLDSPRTHVLLSLDQQPASTCSS